MSAIDEVGFRKNPPVGVLPLGTGNDLSRSLEWGPGYSDTSLSKILNQIEQSNVELMDRWFIDSADHANDSSNNLPLNVMNNYFSIGVDATACLKFHSERGRVVSHVSRPVASIVLFQNLILRSLTLDLVIF